MSTKKELTIDEQLVNKLLQKYGYSFDMGIITYPYEKVDSKIVFALLRGVLQRASLDIIREVEAEEFIIRSYSTYLRRYGRLPRDLLIKQYGEMYASTLDSAHKALLADKPNMIDDDKIMIEMKGGRMDHDVLCDPSYISIYIIKISDTVTGVKVTGNSCIPKEYWTGFNNINALMIAGLSKVYETEALYGRATSLSVRNEIMARYSNGKERDTLSGKRVLEEELNLVGLNINKVLNIADIQIGALFAPRELRMIKNTLMEILKTVKVDGSIIKLIKYLETDIIPECVKTKELPKFTTLFNFSRDLIEKERDPEMKIDMDQVNSISANLAAVISKYIFHSRLLTVDPDVRMGFFQMKLPVVSALKNV